MTIPYNALIGGVLLGISALLLLLFNGKIAGISGILTGLISPKQKDILWRFLFVLGMLLGAFIAVNYFGATIVQSFSTPTWLMIIAGFLVGFGTRIGNGCTSGHGICGMGRLSQRSIIATCIFMVVAVVTVYLRNQFI
ncbi:YeeE/YedE family protein [Thalassotalea aquiviva]|uniref:YeeE/YedE family protein n=1 Tax=Thalassotalea aquiviva TaxID=3242415 RepID=UPI00352B8021